MAFRLMSAVAGAAKRGSERLKALEDDTKKLITTEASRVAEDARNISKARTKSVLEYNQAARTLKSRYKLNDGQVEAVLAGGLDGVDAFKESLESKELEAGFAGKQFNRADAIAAIVPEISPDVAARSQDAQAAAFAASMNPYTNEGIDVAAGTIGASVGAMTRGGRAPTEYIRSQLEAQARAMGGKTPEAFTGPAFGTTPFGFRPTDVTVATRLAAQKAAADIAKIETDVKTAEYNLENTLPADVEQRKAQTEQIYADAGLATTQADRINKLLEGEIKAQEGELQLTGARVKEIASNIKKSDAVIEKMVGEGKLDEANIQLIQARIGKLNIDTETAEALKDLSVKELEAKISQMDASSTLTKARTTELDTRNKSLKDTLLMENEELAARIGLIESQTTATIAEAGLTGTRADALRQDILLNEQFSATERQAALDLVEAKVLTTGRYSDLEEFQVALLDDNRRLNEELKTAGEGPERESIRAKIRDNEARIASSAVALADVESGADLLNKGAAPTVYNHFVRQNLQQFDVDFEYASLDQVISKIGDDQAPAAFGAFANANTEFGNVYAFNKEGGIIDSQGARFVMQKQETLNTAMGSYANRLTNSSTSADKALVLGSMTLAEVAAHDGKEGQVVLVTQDNGDEIGYGVFTGGRFVVARGR